MNLLGPTSNTFISQRLRLHYVDWGNADKPPLLLIHGASQSHVMWRKVAPELAKHFTVVAGDLPVTVRRLRERLRRLPCQRRTRDRSLDDRPSRT